jgi:hypothetical protein
MPSTASRWIVVVESIRGAILGQTSMAGLLVGDFALPEFLRDVDCIVDRG